MIFFLKNHFTSPPDIILPVYKFAMIHHSTGADMGGINLRAGYMEKVIHYRGDIHRDVILRLRARIGLRGPLTYES